MRVVRLLPSCCVVLALLGTSVSAQGTASDVAAENASIDADVTTFDGTSGCPVRLSVVRQGSAMEWRAADYTQPDEPGARNSHLNGGGRPSPPTGQGLEMNFGALASRALVEAIVLVHGWAGAGAMLLEASKPHADVVPQGRRAVIRRFHLRPAAGESSLAHAQLWTSGMTAVIWVEVTRLRYADGSEWLPAQARFCRVTPSPLELVAATE